MTTQKHPVLTRKVLTFSNLEGLGEVTVEIENPGHDHGRITVHFLHEDRNYSYTWPPERCFRVSNMSYKSIEEFFCSVDSRYLMYVIGLDNPGVNLHLAYTRKVIEAVQSSFRPPVF